MTDYDIERIAKKVSQGRVKASVAMVGTMFVLAIGLGAWLENIAGNLSKIAEVHAEAVRVEELRNWISDTAALNDDWRPGEFRHYVVAMDARFFSIMDRP